MSTGRLGVNKFSEFEFGRFYEGGSGPTIPHNSRPVEHKVEFIEVQYFAKLGYKIGTWLAW